MPATTSRNDLAGILWMLTTGLCFVAVNGTVRWLGQALPATEAAFIRFAFGLVFLVPVLVPALRRGFAADLAAVHPARCAACRRGDPVVFAMARITVAEVTAIGFLNPIIVTLGAAR